MAGYTLKLDLTKFQHDTLVRLLGSAEIAGEMNGFSTDPFYKAIGEIREMITGYDEMVEQIRAAGPTP